MCIGVDNVVYLVYMYIYLVVYFVCMDILYKGDIFYVHLVYFAGIKFHILIKFAQLKFLKKAWHTVRSKHGCFRARQQVNIREIYTRKNQLC